MGVLLNARKAFAALIAVAIALFAGCIALQPAYAESELAPGDTLFAAVTFRFAAVEIDFDSAQTEYYLGDSTEVDESGNPTVYPVYTLYNRATGAEMEEGVDYETTLKTLQGKTVTYMSAPGTYILTFTGLTPNYSADSFSIRLHLNSGGWERLAGGSRYSTMAAILEKSFDSSSRRYAIVASGENYADALAASALAGKLQAPIVVTTPGELTNQAKYELHRIGAEKVIVVGGKMAVSEEAVSAIRSLPNVKAVSRLGGANRYETALKVYEALGKVDPSDAIKAGTEYVYNDIADGGGLVPMNQSGIASATWEGKSYAIIANGEAWPDALSISPLAYTAAAPIFLVRANEGLDADTLAAVKAGGFDQVLIVGGKAVVSPEVEKQLADSDVVRLSGENRYQTSVRIAQFSVGEEVLQDTAAVVATGNNFPDALVGSALCGSIRCPLLLVSDTADVAIAGYFGDHGVVTKGYILGGTMAVSEKVEGALQAL